MKDPIERQDVIDAVKCGALSAAMVYGRTDAGSTALSETVRAIKALPSAQQWIPVSERLPKVGQTVICQCRADILKLLKLDSGGDWYQDAEHAYMNGFVIAWMPLPEAYKERREE